jgi:hypothetical protein|tara:strand:- start:11689 stop:12303 length:615 start_codon:yes stop_codon:yes gene_type:complete
MTVNNIAPPRKRRNRDSPDYINNKEFSLAVHEHNMTCDAAEERDEEIPMISNYIASCFMTLAVRIASKHNFNGYSFKEEMIGDAVEMAMKKVRKFDFGAATRGGTPNAFAYFTTMYTNCFIQRIQKEQKQWNIKEKYRDSSSADQFADCSSMDGNMSEGMVERMKNKMDFYKEDRAGIHAVIESKVKKASANLFNEDSPTTTDG